jgi:hypothetical protein
MRKKCDNNKEDWYVREGKLKYKSEIFMCCRHDGKENYWI